jgi:diguanylate cyclase (GGDEF)-like protein/PAS domain S-box-containing protein
MTITDASTLILRVNKAFTETTGYSSEEIVGKHCNIFKSNRHKATFYQQMWKSVELTGEWRGEVWNRRKNGEIFPVWLVITAVKDENGEVINYVGTHIDISERKASEKKILQLAFYDPLTDLPNRRLLMDRLKHGINLERRGNRHMAVLMLDLDKFKAVNDSLGHLAGDELLQQVSTRITKNLRDIDMVARLGGDEFVILLEDIEHIEDAARVAGQIVAELSKPFDLNQSEDVCIGASIGISIYPQHGDTPELLMDNADSALYLAKDQGRGCYAYFSEDLTIAAKKRIAMESRLRHAIANNELRIHYQPQVDMVSNHIIGAEALICWQNPDVGLISPTQFIPIAEESSLIMDIGEWVMTEACKQGCLWLDAGLPEMNIAVNVSPHQFHRSDINALVAKVLAQTGFKAQLLELEITESGLMQYQENTVEILKTLRAQGVKLAIDDFGTGYSSLAYLKRFPLNVLKIDKSFIDDIPFLLDDMEITATIIAMGHILGFKVIAEGVETPEQLAFLKEKSCDSYQGYIKSPPVSAEHFTRMLTEQLREMEADK